MGQVDSGDCWPAASSRPYADGRLGIAEDGIVGAEAADAVRALWQSRTSGNGAASPELDPATLVHGFGAVAVTLAEEVVAARRATGTTDVTVTDVWLEVVGALEPARLADVDSGSGAIELP